MVRWFYLRVMTKDMKTDVSRRAFLGGLIGSVVAAGCRPSGGIVRPSRLANVLRLGVLSDIHVCSEDGDFGKFGDASDFRRALEWFDREGVDAVVVTGDLADNGMRAQLQKVGAAWDAVFPGNLASDGAPVEKLFIYGNHDLQGWFFDGYDRRFFEQSSFDRGKIATDPAAAWEESFHEPYAPIWVKRVKGYQFIGAHWIGNDADGVRNIEAWFREHDAEIDRSKPFFYLQHQPPKGTCFGDTVWGQDGGYATRALAAYPNAVAFSGHAHRSAVDDRFIWQDAFTSIGVGSLRYTCGEEDEVRDYWDSRQGLLVTVEGPKLTVSCRDFSHDCPLREAREILVPTALEREIAE